MASVSASHLILFVASMVIAAGVAGTLTTEVSRVSGAIDDFGVAVSDDIRSNIEIISDAGSAVYDTDNDGNVTLLVKNTGSNELPTDPAQVEVLLDGEFQTAVSISVIGASSWQPDDVVRLEVSAPGLSSGDHRVKVVVNGDSEVFEFRL